MISTLYIIGIAVCHIVNRVLPTIAVIAISIGGMLEE